MENMWLMATSLGLSVRLMGDFGEHPVDNEVKRLLGIPEYLEVVYRLRLGYPMIEEGGSRVQRYVNDFVHYNLYGKELESTERRGIRDGTGR
jgi:nitroreductase